MAIEIVTQAADFIQAMRSGRIGVFPARLTDEERREVLLELGRRNIFGVTIGLNPTTEGGGMVVSRPERRRRRR